MLQYKLINQSTNLGYISGPVCFIYGADNENFEWTHCFAGDFSFKQVWYRPWMTGFSQENYKEGRMQWVLGWNRQQNVLAKNWSFNSIALRFDEPKSTCKLVCLWWNGTLIQWHKDTQTKGIGVIQNTTCPFFIRLQMKSRERACLDAKTVSQFWYFLKYRQSFHFKFRL